MAASSLPPRLVPRQGPLAFERVGLKTPFFRDLYLFLLQISWAKFLALMGSAYLLTNTLFALLYSLDPNGIVGARPNSLTDRLFFSIETMSTIGYGTMAPKTLYAHTLMSVEALLGMFGMALTTGLAFARFSRPTARVLFSQVLVVTQRDGQLSLLCRMANTRKSQVVEAQLRLVLARDERTREGERVRRFHDLTLVRSWTPIFALTWTAVHPIDASSPLFGLTQEDLQACQAEIIATLIGIDETFNQSVHARYSYSAQEVLFGHRFADIIEPMPHGRRIHYTRFHDVLPDGLPNSSQSPSVHHSKDLTLSARSETQSPP